MLELINTLLLTLSQSLDRDRADSLRPKEFNLYCTTHLGFTAIAHQLGLFLPWLRSFCGKSRDSTETCLSERPSGSTTISIIAQNSTSMHLSAFSTYKDSVYPSGSKLCFGAVAFPVLRNRSGNAPQLTRLSSRRSPEYR